MTICVLAAALALAGSTVEASPDILHAFAGGAGDGKNPLRTTPTLSGGTLYGVTKSGGASNVGVIWSMNPDGTGYTNLHEFDYSGGYFPRGKLLVDGSTIYGTTNTGSYSGGYDAGTVFKIDTNGTDFTVLHVFDPNRSEGYGPLGNLAISGGTLYGVTYDGGYDSDGVLYQVDTNGSGFSVVQHFGLDPVTVAHNPRSGPILDGSVLYGTADGGTAGGGDYGVIYSYDLSSSTLTREYDFGWTDGSSPEGAVLLDGSTLYGMTAGGGSANAGVIYKYDLSSSTYTLLHNCVWSTSEGKWPTAELSLSGTTLVGQMASGGANDYGVIFEIETDGTGLSMIHDWTGNATGDGMAPQGGVIIGGSAIYGMTESGGDSRGSGYGVIFAETGALSPASMCFGTADVTYSNNGLLDGGYGLAGLSGEAMEDTIELDNLVLSGGMATLCVNFSPDRLRELGIDEATFRLYWYDTSTSQWLLAGRNSNNNQTTGSDQGDSTPTAVLGDWGIDMTNNYLWANIDHASTFAMAGGAAAGDFVAPAGVDMSDFAVLAGQWLSTPGSPSADIAEPLDNFVDIADLAVFCDNWLVGTE